MPAKLPTIITSTSVRHQFAAIAVFASLLVGCDWSDSPPLSNTTGSAPQESAFDSAEMKAFAEVHIPGVQALIDDLLSHITDRRLRLDGIAKILRSVQRDPAKDEEYLQWSAVLAYLEWELSMAEAARTDAFVAWSKYLANPTAGADPANSAEITSLRKELQRFATAAQQKRVDISDVAAGRKPAPAIPQAAIASRTETTVHTSTSTSPSTSSAPSTSTSQPSRTSPPPGSSVRHFSPAQIEAWKQKAIDDFNAERKRQEENDRRVKSQGR